jgi:hypothetical protein
LQQAQHPPTVVADLDAGADKACVALRQMFALLRQRTNQCRLLTRLDLEFDQLGKAAIFR